MLTGSFVCMPVIGRLHERDLRDNKITSIQSDAFTVLVNLEILYVPPFTIPSTNFASLIRAPKHTKQAVHVRDALPRTCGRVIIK